MSAECLRDGVWMAVLMLTVFAIALGGTAWAYAIRPRWAGLPAVSEPFRLRRWDVLVYVALFAAILAVGIWKVVPSWWMQTDEERDSFFAALCGAGRACPLVGNEMNRLRIPLGPLNRYLMAACWVISPDPRVVLSAILVFHAAASTWTARVADSLFGRPAGLAAGVLLGTNSTLLEVYRQPSNGAWVPVALVGTLWATLRWVRGDGGVPFVAAVTCLACAVQFHGTALVFVPVSLLVAVSWRPRTPRWALLVAAVIVLVAAAPWIRFQYETHGSGFRAFSVGWLLAPSHGGESMGLLGHGVSLATKALVPLRSIGFLSILVVLGTLALVFGPIPPGPQGVALRAARRALLLFLLVPLGVAMAGASVAADAWVDRYNVPYIPAAILVATAALMFPGWLPAHGLSGRVERWAVAALPWIVTVPVVVFLAHTSFARSDNPQAARTRSHGELSLAENIEAIRVLGQHGFRAQDLETRIHGRAWNRWNGAQVYLGHWLLGVRHGAPPTAHVVVSECFVHAGSPDGSVVWEYPLASSRHVRHFLVGYRPALGPVELTFALGTSVWRHEAGLPFYLQQMHPGDQTLRQRLDPLLRAPQAYNMLPTLWLGTPAGSQRATLRAAVTQGPRDRVVALLLPAQAVSEVTLDGHVLTPVREAADGIESQHWYVIPAADRVAGPATLEAHVDLTRETNFPRRMDFYEDPSAGCETP